MLKGTVWFPGSDDMPQPTPLFRFKHGDHACIFYHSDDSLMEVLVPYVAEGLSKGERCFGAQKPHILKRLYHDLRFLGIDVDREIKRGALEFHTEQEVYFPKGIFEPAVMMEMLLQSIADSAQKGFTGFRTAGDLSWAVRGWNMCDQLLGYEDMVAKCYPGRTATGICQYPLADFPQKTLDDVLRAHRLHLAATPDKPYRSMQVAYGHCSAEIVASKFDVNPYYYYVVEKYRPKEIMGWGVSMDFDNATAHIDQLAKESVI